MAVRSIAVKKPLINMMAEHFPEFKSIRNWKGDVPGRIIYGFVRQRSD